ncbi:DUF3397 domain-containing protein [Aquibacillus kalidii]|uniref:DUF3397 domain-containing protein n=1 Tax=Aquibacillus kalidii TaxID=2762597 RepID=UPI001644C4FA|nr:DUF3397 domain-containing protein [Aquibacillus kalidii]
MIDLIAYTLGVCITFPFLLTCIVYIIVKKTVRNKWKAIHFSVNSTTIFYIISVGVMLNVLFGQNFTGIILIILLLILSLFVIIQWKSKGEVAIPIVWKLFWRFTFLLFFVGQFLMVIVGLSLKIMAI